MRRAHFPYTYKVLNYPHAGHRAGMPQLDPMWHNGVLHPLTGVVTNVGGTPEGNAESTLDAIPKVLNFLLEGLALNPPAP